MEPENIHIVLSADNNYAQHLGVTVFSLIQNFNNPNHSLIIHILDGKISETNKKKLNSLTTNKPAKIIYHPVNQKLFKDCPEINHLKLPAYYRLLIPQIIPEGIKKIIYLDSDTVVTGDISILFNQELNDNILGAIKEVSQEEVLNIWGERGITKYFNSGVLLINLEKWRIENISEKAFLFIKENQQELHWADQDALNLVCAQNWQELDKRFNLQIDRNQKQIKNINPIVLHYVGRLKPWHYEYTNYYHKHYWDYLKQTPWKNYRYQDFSLYNLAKKIAKLIPGVIVIRKKIIKWLKIKTFTMSEK